MDNPHDISTYKTVENVGTDMTDNLVPNKIIQNLGFFNGCSQANVGSIQGKKILNYLH